MSTYRVPKCGRHFVKFDDVTIYPVLVVARTVKENMHRRETPGQGFSIASMDDMEIKEKDARWPEKDSYIISLSQIEGAVKKKPKEGGPQALRKCAL